MHAYVEGDVALRRLRLAANNQRGDGLYTVKVFGHVVVGPNAVVGA